MKTPASTQERTIPAVTKQVTRRVVKTPARTQERTIPAVTKTVTRRVVDQAPRLERREIPARYETVSVQKLVQPASTQVVEIPAEYQDVVKRTQVSAERAEWRQVLCEANANTSVISAIQQALKTQGFYTGAVDGRLGQGTYAAVKQFQTSRNLSTGGLTLRTVDALGVNWRSMVSGQSYSGGATGTVTGGSTGFGTGATVGGSSSSMSSSSMSSGSMTAGSYTIGSDGTARNSAGVVVGRVNGNGDIVSTSGQILMRGAVSAGSMTSGSMSSGSMSSGSMTSGSSSMSSGSAGGFTLMSDGTVRNSSGVTLGTLDRATGNIVAANGSIVGRMALPGQ